MQLHVIGYVRDCFIGVIKFSVVLLSHQKKGSLAPRPTLQIQEPLYTQKINTETSTETLTATRINAILFALQFAGFWYYKGSGKEVLNTMHLKKL